MILNEQTLTGNSMANGIDGTLGVTITGSENNLTLNQDFFDLALNDGEIDEIEREQLAEAYFGDNYDELSGAEEAILNNIIGNLEEAYLNDDIPSAFQIADINNDGVVDSNDGVEVLADYEIIESLFADDSIIFGEDETDHISQLYFGKDYLRLTTIEKGIVDGIIHQLNASYLDDGNIGNVFALADIDNDGLIDNGDISKLSEVKSLNELKVLFPNLSDAQIEELWGDVQGLNDDYLL